MKKAILILALSAILPFVAVTAQEEQKSETTVVTSTMVGDETLSGEVEAEASAEPETVAEPELRLDEPPKKSPRSGSILPLIATVLSIVAIILAGSALLAVKRLRRELTGDFTVETYDEPVMQMPSEPEVIPSKILRKTEPKPVEPAETKPIVEKAAPQPRRLYLSRPDDNQCFTRATEQFERGNSLFLLTTDDGKNGTFTIINDPDVHQMALMMPTQNLTRACSGNAIQTSVGKTRVVTDREGKAVLENGLWHITLKAIIHYE